MNFRRPAAPNGTAGPPINGFPENFAWSPRVGRVVGVTAVEVSAVLVPEAWINYSL
jgi:hypothetical protein